MKNIPVWVILCLQAILLFFFEHFIPHDYRFVSAFGAVGSVQQLPLALVPFLLLVAIAIPSTWRAIVFVMTLIFIARESYTTILIIALSLVSLFYTCRFKLHSSIGHWLLITTILAAAIYAQLQTDSWAWSLIHMGLGIKSIAWVVSVRVYRYQFNFRDYLDYFINPVFFVFTNDLNVLTPKAFLDSKKTINLTDKISFTPLLMTFVGLFLIIVYGMTQKFYFMQLHNIQFLSEWYFGGAISIATAVLFHTANVAIQVSLLQSTGHSLKVDMNQPWLAVNTMDYWRRMHFYVRDYVLEIILKPILTTMLRMNLNLVSFRFFVVILLYFGFTIFQIGHQPFRADRTLSVTLMINAIFIFMVLVPELLRIAKVQYSPRYGRLLTFIILYIGYSIIFSLRASF